ncbi:RraA family protein [Agrobacterium rubi]|nr:RraA family protein [Agrobacterium rubi]NTF08915.1 RraA family protein [Agrobacterium rubi]NTF21186.1 RraA family protein [Agrobacterium rubi]NTF28043.1 RraA family protein [Agrobacterium rubi]
MTFEPNSSEEKALFDGFRSTATALISDNLNRLPAGNGLRPFHKPNGLMIGRALTVRVAAGDNKHIHLALDMVKPGDVIVVDGDGETTRALIGGIMVAIAKSRGAAGFVLHGAVRDTDEIGSDTFPVFAHAAIHRGPYKNGPGYINVSVALNGMVVSPGDIVVGDRDGVVAFTQEEAPALLEATLAQARKEEEIMAQIAAGTYKGAYAK